MGENEARATARILAADVTPTLGDYAIAGAGVLSVEGVVANDGNLEAEAVVLSASWTPRSGADGIAGSAQTVASIGRLAPGERTTASFVLPVATGAYDLSLAASTPSREAFADNNVAHGPIEVEYAALIVEATSADVTGYTHDGHGEVALAVRVTNAGVAPTGPLTIGVVCSGDAAPGCSQTRPLGDSLAPASTSEIPLALTLPQGVTEIRFYAGDDDDGYRWGERNVASRDVDVPRKPAVDLALAAPMEVGGYWSDGTANVEVELTLRNDGYRPVTDLFAVTVSCYAEEAPDTPLSACGGVEPLTMADGFGPAAESGSYRVPMGATVRASLPGGAEETLGATVPERILGVERKVWECYNDRPADGSEGCSGYAGPTVRKWPRNQPIRVWADPEGDSRYVDTLQETLEETAPILGLQFDWVASEEEANLQAYVGVPTSKAEAIGLPPVLTRGAAEMRWWRMAPPSSAGEWSCGITMTKTGCESSWSSTSSCIQWRASDTPPTPC